MNARPLWPWERRDVRAAALAVRRAVRDHRERFDRLAEDDGPHFPEGFVIRPGVPFEIGSGSTTMAPYCSICHGFHIPGMGDCTRTWTITTNPNTTTVVWNT